MYLNVKERPDRPGVYQIVGTVPGYEFLRQTPRKIGRDKAAVEAEAARLEAKMLRDKTAADLGLERPSDRDRPLSDIAEAYLEHEPRHPSQIKRVKDIVAALGRGFPAADAVGDAVVTRLKKAMLRDGVNATPATVRAKIVTPLRAVMNFGADSNPPMCARPKYKLPTIETPDTDFFRPSEAVRFLGAASRHFRDLCLFCFCCGARIGEALTLDWNEVNLRAATATFLGEKTKMGKTRIAALPPVGIELLAGLPGDRTGPVFMWETVARADGSVKRRRPYAFQAVEKGGDKVLPPSGPSIGTGWRKTLLRAGITRKLTPHDMRASWASWFYAIHHDLAALKEEGGWESYREVEIYRQTVAFGEERIIGQIWGLPAALVEQAEARNQYNRYTLIAPGTEAARINN